MTFKPMKLDRDRVTIMGETMTSVEPGTIAACCVDADGGDGQYDGKADWYVAQLREQYPAVVIGKRFDGPVPGTHTIMIESPPIQRRGHSEK